MASDGLLLLEDVSSECIRPYLYLSWAQYVTYLVFDAPALDKPYEERLAFIQSCIRPIPSPAIAAAPVPAPAIAAPAPASASAAIDSGAGTSHSTGAVAGTSSSSIPAVGTPYAAPVGAITCTGRAHVSAELAKVEACGGEGLMLRRPGSKYEHCRSKHLLKVRKSA